MPSFREVNPHKLDVNRTFSSPYPNGISGFKPLYLAPTGNVFSTKVDGEPESNFVVYASVFGGNPAPGEWDPGPEEIIEPTPAISALSYRESVTFEVAYLTPAR